MFKKWIKNKTYLKTESNLWSIILLQPTACSHVFVHENLEKQTELDWMRNSSVNRRLLIAWSFKPRAEAVFFVYEEKKHRRYLNKSAGRANLRADRTASRIGLFVVNPMVQPTICGSSLISLMFYSMPLAWKCTIQIAEIIRTTRLITKHKQDEIECHRINTR